MDSPQITATVYALYITVAYSRFRTVDDNMTILSLLIRADAYSIAYVNITKVIVITSITGIVKY